MPAISFQCFQILEEEVHNDPGVTGGFIARSAALLRHFEAAVGDVSGQRLPTRDRV